MKKQQTDQRPGPQPNESGVKGRRRTGHPVESGAILVILIVLTVGLGACNRDEGVDAGPLPPPTPAPATGVAPALPTPLPPTAAPAAAVPAAGTATATPTPAPAATAVPTATSVPVALQPLVTVHGDMNVRASPSIDSPVVGATTIGQEFPITGKSEDGNWWQIEIDGQLGWIFAPYVTAINAENVPVAENVPMAGGDEAMMAENAVVTVNGDMNVRAGPGTDYPAVGAATFGQEFPITGQNAEGDWWQIDIDGQAGWIYAPFVTASNAENVPIIASEAMPASEQALVTLNGDMNVRAGPGTNHPVVAAATLGQEVPVSGRNEEGDWWQVEINGQTGWIYAPFVVASNAENVPVVTSGEAPSSGQALLTLNGDMNVRQGPGTNYPVVGAATLGQEFLITGRNEAGAWWRIDYEDQAGWIFAAYVTAANAENVPVVSADSPPPTTAPQETDSALRGQRADIVDVVDGDTLDVRFESGGTDRIRLFDINAPEVVGEIECYGRQASVYANLFNGQKVTVESGGRNSDDRLLAYIWLADGRLLNEELAKQGYAEYNDYGNPGIYAARIRAAADQAQSEGVGMWSQCTVDESPTPIPTPAG